MGTGIIKKLLTNMSNTIEVRNIYLRIWRKFIYNDVI